MNYPVALVSGVARNTRPPAGLALARASASGGVRARNGREKTVLGDNREDGGLELALVAFDVRRVVAYQLAPQH